MTITEAIREPPPKRSTELANAVYDDWKRKAIDTAKKRAAAQFADYESFKNMVLTAHLKPLGEKIDHDGKLSPSRGVVLPDALPAVAASAVRQRASHFPFCACCCQLPMEDTTCITMCTLLTAWMRSEEWQQLVQVCQGTAAVLDLIPSVSSTT